MRQPQPLSSLMSPSSLASAPASRSAPSSEPPVSEPPSFFAPVSDVAESEPPSTLDPLSLAPSPELPESVIVPVSDAPVSGTPVSAPHPEIGVCVHPPAETEQPSVVHGSPSLQFFSVTVQPPEVGSHAATWHASAVHFVACVHPVASAQPSVVHGSPSSQSSGVVGVHAPEEEQLPAVKHLLDGVHPAPGVTTEAHPVGSTHSFAKQTRVLGGHVTGGPATHVPSVPEQ